MINSAIAEHYTWGQNCDGWKLVSHPGLTVIQERMPPGAKEVRHYHERALQFFFVLSGVATMEVNGSREMIMAGQGTEIPPGAPHQIFNEAPSDLEFLVISQPSTQGDRVLAE
ncbi:MAG TPA: cupin domain-containing protein [Anaerolineales bacterium]|nr:cupin domain-containing protein [Anaerolineales bacterium]